MADRASGGLVASRAEETSLSADSATPAELSIPAAASRTHCAGQLPIDGEHTSYIARSFAVLHQMKQTSETKIEPREATFRRQ